MNDIFSHFENIKAHPKCENCGKEFTFWGRWCGQCDGCKKFMCSSCMQSMKDESELFAIPVTIKGDYCDPCFQVNVAPSVARIEFAKANFEEVEIFTSNYRGKVAIPGSERRRITTDFYRDRDDAEIMLKRTAAFLDCDVVFDVELRKRTDSEDSNNGNGTYKFSVWSFTGIPAKSSRKRR